MSIPLGIALGLGLSAACGFRVFVPFFVAGAAGAAGVLDLSGGFEWISTTPALVTFGVATALEVSAYYIPWVDNLLDSIASPSAILAGAVVAVAVQGDADPLLRWGLMAIAGGGMAAVVQSASVLTRLGSSALTAGFGNFVVATLELFAAATLAVVSIALPFVGFALAVVLAVALLFVALTRFLRSRRALAEGEAAG